MGAVWAQPRTQAPWRSLDPPPGSHWHWPLSLSQVGSVSSCTPGPEQLHSSQPTRGWQPKVWGWQTAQSGGTVRGGQTQRPVSSSHKRPLQSQAVGPHTGLVSPSVPLRGPDGSSGRQGWGHPTPPPTLVVPPSSTPEPQAPPMTWGQWPRITI